MDVLAVVENESKVVAVVAEPSCAVIEVPTVHAVAVVTQPSAAVAVVGGAEGPRGPAGRGLIFGGLPGQIIAKASGVDYDIVWIDPDYEPGGAVAAHEAAVNPHPQYATDDDLTAHVTALDPHSQYATDEDLTAHATALDPHSQYATDEDLTAHAAAVNPHSQYAIAEDLAAHITAIDPHSQYTTDAEASQLAITAVGLHEGKVDPHPQYSTAVTTHVQAVDPHPQYLTLQEGLAIVDAHEAETDPHAQYVTYAAASDQHQAHLDSLDPHTQYVQKVDGSGLITNSERIKLAGLENYVHPDSHAASMITEDESHRFVTDLDKQTWSNKQDALTITPVPNTRTVNGKELSSDVNLTTDDVPATATNSYMSIEQLDMFTYMRQAYVDRMASGLVYGGELTRGTGVTVNIAAGVGHIVDEAGTVIKRVTWGNTNGTGLFTGANYVGIGQDGTVSISASKPSILQYIYLGYFYVDQTVTQVIEIFSVPEWASKFDARVNDFVENCIGPVVVNGFNVAESTPLNLHISAGVMSSKLTNYSLDATNSFVKIYQITGHWFPGDQDVIDVTNYNDVSQGLVAMTAGWWSKSLLLRVPGGQVYFVYSQAQYATEDEARAAALPMIPDVISKDAVYLASLVVQQGTLTIADGIQDIRPLFSRIFGYGTAGAAASAISHGSLTGLSTDDHPQYLTTARGDMRYEPITGHATATDNPHQTTALQVGAQAYHGVYIPGTYNFDAGTRTLSVSGLAYYYKGKLVTVVSASVQISNTVGLWYVSFNDDTGTLSAAQTGWSLYEQVPIVTIYWTGSLGAVINERHKHDRNLGMHAWAHKNIGCFYASGLQMSAPSVATPSVISFTAGSIEDEELVATISTQSNGRLWYQTGANSWSFDNVTAAYGSSVRYVNSSYVLTAVPDNGYINYWFYAAPDNERAIYVFMEQRSTHYTTAASARATSPPSLSGTGISPELRLLYRAIFKGDETFVEATDYRRSAVVPQAGGLNTTAAAVTFTPAGNVSAGNVQLAIEELDAEKQAVAEKGVANGYASLGADGKVPSAQLPTASGGGLAGRYIYMATTNQTVFTGADSQAKTLTFGTGEILVYWNGHLCMLGSEYTVGTNSITMTRATYSSDVIQILCF